MTEIPRELEVGYSTCPNDTFVFHALVTGKVPTRGVTWKPHLADVETLNEMAFQRTLPITKLSFHALGYLRQEYALLSAGAALGRGCGPLLLTRPQGCDDLERARIAVPGFWTTACLLLRLHAPQISKDRLVSQPFHRIPASIAEGEVDAGVIIHESRFTYEELGLVCLVDLGQWWERETGLPIPLGAIVGDRRLGPSLLREVQDALRRSVIHARRHPQESREYVACYAHELSPEVTQAHIDLYVNDFTEDLGSEGSRAVRALFRRAEGRGILPPGGGAPLLVQ
jgi:1,4-dihydroxy-6-naphthoate synthase